MRLHGNARLSLHGRRPLVERVLDQHFPLQMAAEAAGVSTRTAAKWVARFRAEGELGLLDRSSAPHRVPKRTPEARVVAIAALRRLRMTAAEIARVLGMALSTVSAVLGRIGLDKRSRLEPLPACDSPSEDAIVAKFVSAYESADLDAVVALLTDDVFISMPPMPLEYEGRDVATRFCASIFGSGRRFDLVPTRANGQPAFGAYLRAPGGIAHGVGLLVLTLSVTGSAP
jgi:transposase